MEAVKKHWLWGIFISILSIFAMSHNASAAPISFPVEFTGTFEPTYVRCRVDQQSFVQVAGKTCVWGPNVGGNLQGRGLNFIESSPIPVRQNTIYEILLTVGTSVNAELMVPAAWGTGNSGNFQLVYFEKVSNDNNLGSSATYEGYVSQYVIGLRSLINNDAWPVQYGYSDGSGNIFYLVGDNWPVVIDARIEKISRYAIIDNSASTQSIVNAINQLKQSNQQQVQEERDELEQGQSDLQDAGADSTQDAQQGTASLLSAIGQAVGVISSASPTNCRLNGNMGNLNIGQLDLCANPAPAFIQTIGSLILILMCVPLAISLFNRFINLFRSFQS